MDRDGDDPESDPDSAPLSPASLAGIRELHDEQERVHQLTLKLGEEKARAKLLENDLSKFFPEDWQISQFWYDKETTRTLVTEIQRLLDLDPNVRVACISCPSVFRCCRPATSVDLYEYDRRFEAFGASYYFYDFNRPEDVPEHRRNSYSVIILDPPFLSNDCVQKMSHTVKKLASHDAKVILCTAADLEEEASEYLGLHKTHFVPKHRENGVTLRKAFACFCNYNFQEV